MKRSIPILLYHHISPDREIAPEGFERQLCWMLEQGYRSLSMSELMDVIQGRASEDKPGFVLTLDDGYLDNWVYMFPILKKLSVKATIFLVTERIETHSAPRPLIGVLDTRTHEREAGGFISWAEARLMAGSGLVEFGSHTNTHRHWTRGEKYANIEEELSVSKQVIEAELKRPCLHLAWPWGDYETSWWPLLEKIGYETALTTQAGANARGTNPFALKRISVRRDTVEWLSGRFRWNSSAVAASTYALMYGWDKRFKAWLHAESPYPHG